MDNVEEQIHPASGRRWTFSREGQLVRLVARGCISWDYGWSFEGELVNGKLILKRHFHLEVAARNRRINRGRYAVRMLEYNNRQFAPREVLLVLNVFVRSHQQLKVGGLGCRNQISVFQILPPSGANWRLLYSSIRTA